MEQRSIVIGFPPDNLYNHDVYTGFLSFDTDNDFIPIDCIRNGTLYQKPTGEKRFEYELKVPVNPSYAVRILTRFIDRMFTTEHWHKFEPRGLILNYHLYCRKGILVHIKQDPFKVTPLVVLCVKRRHLFDINPSSINLNHFTLLVDNRMVSAEPENEFHSIYRGVNRYYINVMKESIDTYYSNDITQLCFKSPAITLPKFKTLGERSEHISKVNEVIFN